MSPGSRPSQPFPTPAQSKSPTAAVMIPMTNRILPSSFMGISYLTEGVSPADYRTFPAILRILTIGDEVTESHFPEKSETPYVSCQADRKPGQNELPGISPAASDLRPGRLVSPGGVGILIEYAQPIAYAHDVPRTKIVGILNYANHSNSGHDG